MGDTHVAVVSMSLKNDIFISTYFCIMCLSRQVTSVCDLLTLLALHTKGQANVTSVCHFTVHKIIIVICHVFQWFMLILRYSYVKRNTNVDHNFFVPTFVPLTLS